MELLMALVIGFLVAAGTYLILRQQIFKLALGFSLYAHAVNLLLIAAGGFDRDKIPPFIQEGTTHISRYMDPFPPDIILTAIVIAFAVSAFFLSLIARIHREWKTDKLKDIEGHE